MDSITNFLLDNRLYTVVQLHYYIISNLFKSFAKRLTV